jgi:hypothetical protein
MFQRLILQGSAELYSIAAFAVATSIFGAFTWRAVRMRRPQLDRFSQLPFETATPASQHERRTETH